MEELVQAAMKAREHAYAPYSRFKVGCAVLGVSRKIYTGCNVENASFGLTLCAERVAIAKAVSDGERKLPVLAVVADTPGPTAPCGACRQLMLEFGVEKIIMGNVRGDRQEMSLEDLLPYAFHQSDMGETKP